MMIIGTNMLLKINLHYPPHRYSDAIKLNKAIIFKRAKTRFTYRVANCKFGASSEFTSRFLHSIFSSKVPRIIGLGNKYCVGFPQFIWPGPHNSTPCLAGKGKYLAISKNSTPASAPWAELFLSSSWSACSFRTSKLSS